MKRQLARVFLLAPMLAGCGSDKELGPVPPFQSEEHVQVWATSASALGVYVHAYEPIAVADGHLNFQDPACPMTSDDGTTLTIAGGCTDEGDRQWSGRATVTRDGGERTLTFEDFDGKDGTMVVRTTGPSFHEFHADLVIGGVTTIGYDGTIEGDYTGRTTWNGSGTVRRDGLLAPTGIVEATTVDEVVDDGVCSGQPVSGSTTLQSRGDTAVITYDGATDCDAEQNARFSVNDRDRGMVSGINCAIDAPGRSDRAGRFGVAVALAALCAALGRRLRPS
ncbi:hypothetical protein WME79_15385 [Sorangium sp. So ce726]|uniref:hypothetical protein n=1 Tax=Sorangium sp. So ce726 TaxID=3133319 RepID=UPI003F621E15